LKELKDQWADSPFLVNERVADQAARYKTCLDFINHVLDGGAASDWWEDRK
jgi:hypothetical protein